MAAADSRGDARDATAPASAGDLLELVRTRRAHLVAVARVVELAAGDTDDPGVLRQLVLEVAEIERRQQLAQREVPGAAEHDEVARRGEVQGCLPGCLGGRTVHPSTVGVTWIACKRIFGISQT